ncbi:hypothetical protein PR202_gb21978 [Eleusine coracana subsp. coracana]|uniref:C2 domain-containing protein n=1 Tax=Eleusine coracana subsp. coracana TaxID=191504 RepID=A0AAV5FF31_ELECO|nr:hypothetical protein QOZ80_7BG0612300 [Eleusine coracana subsp. coracana]GJN33381.1 hypothetical protein PR202_gb21978 [Eleusine coracana subsp. coracana]
MAYRVLEVTVQSAKDLKRVNLLSRMEVYAVVTLSGDPLTRQSTPPDPYGGRHPCWNATFRFNVPATSSSATGCLHVLLRTERALGDRDVGEVIVPLADVLAGGDGDPGQRPQQCATYTVRKVHRCEPRGRLNVSFRLGPVVAPPHQQQAAARVDYDHGGGHVVAFPMGMGMAPPFYHPSPYGYLPPTMSPAAKQAYTGGHHDGVLQHSAAGQINAYNNFPGYSSLAAAAAAAGGYHDGVQPPPASASGPANMYNSNPTAYSQQAAAAGYPAAPPPTKGGNNNTSDGNKQMDFGVGLGAGLVSGAIGGMLASDMMAEAAAYSYGYRAGLADGGGAAAMYKNSSHHVPAKVHDTVESKRAMVV